MLGIHKVQALRIIPGESLRYRQTHLGNIIIIESNISGIIRNGFPRCICNLLGVVDIEPAMLVHHPFIPLKFGYGDRTISQVTVVDTKESVPKGVSSELNCTVLATDSFAPVETLPTMIVYML